MRTTLKVIGSAFLGGVLLLPNTRSLQTVAATPPSDTKPKHELVPDFCQRDTRYGKFPWDGKVQCGPAAVSNLIIYLHRTSFPGLLSKKNPSPYDQAELINLLSSDKYMKLDKVNGVSPHNLMSGLKQYLVDKGYEADVQYIGYQVDDIDKNQNLNGGGYITPIMIKDKFDQGFECIVRIGYYKNNVRIDGHYAAVVGFKGGDERKILVHDSSGGSGLEKKTEVWNLRREKNRNGYWEVMGVANAGRGETIYLDGAIVFKLLKK